MALVVHSTPARLEVQKGTAYHSGQELQVEVVVPGFLGLFLVLAVAAVVLDNAQLSSPAIPDKQQIPTRNNLKGHKT